jgi:flagella basal body P-ring formation protein FlgA
MLPHHSLRRAPLLEKHPLRSCFVTGCVLICHAMAPLLASQKFQSLGAIRAKVHQSMQKIAGQESQSHAEIEVGRLDPRLRLPACKEALGTFLPQGGRKLGNTTMGVRCNGVKPWTLYVPVKVALYREVLVTTRPLARGESVSTTDLRMEQRNLATLRTGYLTSPKQAIGKLAKRFLTAGTALSASNLDVQRVIKRGEKVTLLIDIPGIQVRATAKALSDGAVGETISVRNTASQKVVQAMVVSPGLVRVRQ